MYFYISSFILLLTALITSVLGSQLQDRTLGIADIPSCGLTCLLQTVPAAGCSLLDTECQCKSEELTYSTAACILANCTMADSLGTAKVQAELCNLPHESKSGALFASLTTVYATVCIFVASRFATRLLTKRMRIDDWIISAALILATAAYASASEMVRHGFGKHLWDLEPGQLQSSLQYFYICWNLYVVTLGLVKVSLIAFYLQVFHDHRFRIICFITLGYIILSSLVIQILTILSCTPIKSFWDRDVKGKCLDVGAIGFANSANAILQDLIILILPIPSLLKVQLKKWRKVAVTLMFAVGAFGCITTIIRLHSLAGFKISFDPTWDYADVTIWTGAELAAGIVCASLPAVRQLLTMILPERFHAFLTNRSRSRSTPRGRTPSVSRQRKGHSLYPLPSLSEHGISASGFSTSITSSSWTNSQTGTMADIECGRVHNEVSQGLSWLPSPKMFQIKSWSMRNSLRSWSDRARSPPLEPRLTHPPHVTSFQAISGRTEIADSTRSSSADEQMELLRIPENSYRASSCRYSDYSGITALPRIGLLPDEESLWFCPPRKNMI